ncbi:MAG: 16S rRNA (adenine(1518)-N(6)/adenine(1519)-N(6))-dimethyltransferase RsmA [Bdellovibrionales bacterium]
MVQYSLQDVKAKLAELGISPKRALGQNFLINQSSCQKILQAVQSFGPKSIIEVGPGLGAITELLLTLNVPMKVMELDSKFSEMWRSRGVDVLEGDALHVNWTQLGMPEPTTLVSNLPYQISSRLVVDRCLEPGSVRHMVLMFQKEVAERMMSKHGVKEYGLLSVIAQSAWDIEKLFEISSKDFFPPPAVASRVLVFKFKGQALEQRYLNLVKAAFGQRRKLLLSNLSKYASGESVKKCFEKLGLNPQCRAEELSPRQFQEIYQCLRS